MLIVTGASDPGEIRTHDRQIRNLLLYPTELRDHVIVGVARFELTTSCSQSRRDNQTTLHPDTVDRTFYKERKDKEIAITWRNLMKMYKKKLLGL